MFNTARLKGLPHDPLAVAPRGAQQPILPAVEVPPRVVNSGTQPPVMDA